MIFIAGISIALFISALLFVKKDKSKADMFLFLWMILNALHLSLFYLLFSGTIYNYPFLLGLHFPLPLLHGVLLYYYVSSVTNQFPKKKYRAFFHLVPPILTFIYLIPYIILPSEQKIEVFRNDGQGYEVFLSILLFAVFFSGIIYVIWSSILLVKHKKHIYNQFSDTEEIDLRWLQFLIYGLGVIWLLIIFSQNDIMIFGGVSIFVILIGFFGVQQKSIFNNQKSNLIKIKHTLSERNTNENKNNEQKEKYFNSGLSDELEEELHEKLNKFMKQDELYKKNDLSLTDLAGKMEVHPNYLSQIINKKESKNFYDYVNTFRVIEFKRLIAIPENRQFTLMAIAYDCGFNSKSSFNRYIKKITGQTPSQYVKVLKS